MLTIHALPQKREVLRLIRSMEAKVKGVIVQDHLSIFLFLQ